MSLLLEMHSNSIPASYMALFPHLLQPALWERTGNIPPLVRLLQAFLEKGGATISTSASDKIVSGTHVLVASSIVDEIALKMYKLNEIAVVVTSHRSSLLIMCHVFV